MENYFQCDALAVTTTDGGTAFYAFGILRPEKSTEEETTDNLIISKNCFEFKRLNK